MGAIRGDSPSQAAQLQAAQPAQSEQAEQPEQAEQAALGLWGTVLGVVSVALLAGGLVALLFASTRLTGLAARPPRGGGGSRGEAAPWREASSRTRAQPPGMCSEWLAAGRSRRSAAVFFTAAPDGGLPGFG